MPWALPNKAMNTTNIVPKRYDPDTVHAGPQDLRRRVTQFSNHDLRQLLCEAMEALEQVDGYTHEVQRLLEQWRRSRPEPSDAYAGYDAQAIGSVWSWAPCLDEDESGLPNVLPTLYAADGYQVDEGGVVARVDELSRDDLMQSLCHCVLTLNALYVNLTGLTALVNDWRRGALRGSEHFALTP